MIHPWQIAVEIPPVWVTRGKGTKRRTTKVPGLPALHNLGSGRWGAKAFTAPQEKLLKAELLKWRRPSLGSEQRYSILLVRVSRHPLDWDVSNDKAGELFRAIGGDNAGSSLKHARDIMAWWLRLRDDRDPRAQWGVGQCWGPPGYVGIEVFLAARTEHWWELPERFLRGELTGGEG
jgi:hypothetical protein